MSRTTSCAASAAAAATAVQLGYCSKDGQHQATIWCNQFTTTEERPCVILLPALGTPAKVYASRLCKLFCEADLQLCIVEQRGHGDSSCRPSFSCNWGFREAVEQDLLAAFDVITTKFPHSTSRIILGHSIGGQLGTIAAAMHNVQVSEPARRINGVVLVASCSSYWRKFPDDWFSVGLAAMFLPLLSNMFGYSPGKLVGFGKNEARQQIRDWAEHSRTGCYHPKYEKALETLDVPVLGITIEGDTRAPIEAQQFFMDKLGTCSKDCPGRGDGFDKCCRNHKCVVLRTNETTWIAPRRHFAWIQDAYHVGETLGMIQTGMLSKI